MFTLEITINYREMPKKFITISEKLDTETGGMESAVKIQSELVTLLHALLLLLRTSKWLVIFMISI
jgi:hypothetical protein